MIWPTTLITVALIQSTSTPVQSSTAPASSLSEDQAVYSELVGYIAAEADILSSGAANFEASFNKGLAANGGEALEARFPGITKVVGTAGKNETLAILREGYPEIRGIILAELRKNLTPQEARDANRFYGSPTGQKLIRAGVAGARGSSLDAISTSGQQSAVAAMGPEDQPALLQFAGTSAFKKIAVLGPPLQRMSADWATALIAKSDARLKAVVQAAMNAHLSKLRSKK
ncbi:DUF2059 domain-containing protein [Sphingomonas sp. CCH18-H6]|jgi:hypothetical protein|uniref:DUF2059 domain-containing protein n=1 Tax=Sphingomonas sp. CCH18-H6 TaxID=1768787 RepID=UPI0009EC2F2E|nr:DUF2059 domain-containing protein [Sphingomonas sp. CCH18-H6]